jgi:murein DD-endopeptidase MepM/ murein hydrolase activator NlpD
MFNKITFFAMVCIAMMSMISAESSAAVKSACNKGMLREEVNRHRLTHSTLIVSPDALRTDRHRFILERLGKPKTTLKYSNDIAKVCVVPVNTLQPVMADETKKYNTLYSDKENKAPKVKFDWTMMPPVKAPIAYKFGHGEKKLSQGAVYKVSANQIVHAPVDGIVIFSGVMKDFEHVVMIEKDFENIILVAGISNADVKQGDKVYRGQKIGSVIKGRWVYIEFRNAGTSIDPQQVLVSGKINEE